MRMAHRQLPIRMPQAIEPVVAASCGAGGGICRAVPCAATDCRGNDPELGA
jgi:hypothetical protein